MELALKKHRPQLKHFSLTFAFTLLLYATFLALLYLLFWAFASQATFQEFWKDISSSTGIWLFPLVGGIIPAFSLRHYTLTLSGIDRPDEMANWAVHVLQEENKVYATSKTETVLAPENKFHKLFRYWLGCELVHVRYSHNQVTVTGHYRHIDLVESKIKFGKPVFN